MRTEVRFLLAVGLMLLVLIGTNVMFPPIVPDEPATPDSTGVTTAVDTGASVVPGGGTTPSLPSPPPGQPSAPGVVAPSPAAPGPAVSAAEQRVAVESPLYRFEFSNVGARLVSAEMLQFQSLRHDELVNLLPEGADGYLGQRLLVGQDTVDLSRAAFSVSPEGGLQVEDGGGPQTLTFVYQHPTEDFRFEVDYTFTPGLYLVGVNGSVSGVDRPVLLTDLGEGLRYVEADSTNEVRMMAYTYKHLGEGVRATILSRANPTFVEGPMLWAAFKNKYFVLAMIAGESEESLTDADYLGALLVGESPLPERVRAEAAQTIGRDGTFAYRLFIGPLVYERLSSLGQDMEEVNPYGYRFMRPIVRPVVSIIIPILTFLHNTLSVGYGWVLIIFSLGMRILLFPLNQKAMKANLRNMAVQPLVAEVQKRYKDNPEKLQKEMMKLYKEHGFNPLAGCLPMLLPWPILVALFFVFQNTIEFRGVPFLWLPDLSAHDPLYVLPVLLAVSMFTMQWVGMRSMDQSNPQMKMMLYFMPLMMLFIFFRLPSGLNLYYATTQVAMIPQQIWIAGERKKVRGKPPPKLSDD